MVKPFASPPPSARRSRGESAVSRLRRDILHGRHRPGDRLPPERELATRLGTNRNTLREALRTLESENLVRARQGDGTMVLDWRTGGEINLLPSFLAEETPADERFDAVLTLLNLRERLLDEVLGQASAHAEPDEIEAIHAALVALRDARPGQEMVAADVELYRRVVLASHSLVLIWVYNTFAKIFLELGQRYPMLWQIDAPYLEGVARMVRWIEEKRPNRAREEMRHVFEERGMALIDLLRPEAAAAESSRRLARKRSR
jgi:GntR family transcriptional repressor for pyruvate dehydrogenase complex